jgi:hypothetical protein
VWDPEVVLWFAPLWASLVDDHAWKALQARPVAPLVWWVEGYVAKPSLKDLWAFEVPQGTNGDHTRYVLLRRCKVASMAPLVGVCRKSAKGEGA